MCLILIATLAKYTKGPQEDWNMAWFFPRHSYHFYGTIMNCNYAILWTREPVFFRDIDANSVLEKEGASFTSHNNIWHTAGAALKLVFERTLVDHPCWWFIFSSPSKFPHALPFCCTIVSPEFLFSQCFSTVWMLCHPQDSYLLLARKEANSCVVSKLLSLYTFCVSLHSADNSFSFLFSLLSFTPSFCVSFSF